jgi:hypothetical protein
VVRLWHQGTGVKHTPPTRRQMRLKTVTFATATLALLGAPGLLSAQSATIAATATIAPPPADVGGTLAASTLTIENGIVSAGTTQPGWDIQYYGPGAHRWSVDGVADPAISDIQRPRHERMLVLSITDS